MPRPVNQDTEQLNIESPNLPGHGFENAEDLANILADQDETSMSDPSANDPEIGSDGTDEDFGLDPGEFARGEIDVKEQMDRVMASMNSAHHRAPDPNATPNAADGRIDTTSVVQDSMSNRTGANPEEMHLKTVEKGHETGAYTDIGAGKSGVTKTHH